MWAKENYPEYANLIVSALWEFISMLLEPTIPDI